MPPAPTPASIPSPAQAPAPTPPAPAIPTSSPDAEQREQFTDQTDATVSPLTLKEALALFESAKKYTDTGHRTNWDNYFKVYKGKRVIRNYEGVSDPVIRESHTIIETLVANIAGGNPAFHFVPTNEEQAQDTEVLNGMLDYYMICNQMNLKNQEWVREMLLYGTAILGVEWRDGKPFIFNIPLRDFFVDPTSTGMVQTLNPAQWAGYEYLANKADLKLEQIYDSDAKAWVSRYTGLDDLGPIAPSGSGSKAKAMDKEFKDLFVKSTLGEAATKDQVHIIKLHHLPTGRIYEIGNKKAFIYNKPTWCEREELSRDVAYADPETGEDIPGKQTLDEIEPFLPFAVLRDYIDSSQFYGEGEMALLINDAELLNDYESMQIDNNAYQNTPMYWVDPQFADMAPEIETIPGAVYPIPRNAMGALDRPQLTGDLDQKQELIMQRMRRATAADEEVQGGSAGNSRTTATEVSTQLQQAQMRFATKITNLESEGYAQLALLIFKCVQIFVTKTTAVRITGPRGIVFKDFDPWEYNGKWEAHVKLDSTIKRDSVEVGLKDQAVFEAMSGNILFDQVEVVRWWVQRKDPMITDDKFNSFLAKAPVPIRPTIKDYLQVAYKDLEPWGRYQAQKELEWDPDPSLLQEMHTRAINQASNMVDAADPATRSDGSLVPGLEHISQPPAPTPAMIPAH